LPANLLVFAFAGSFTADFATTLVCDADLGLSDDLLDFRTWAEAGTGVGLSGFSWIGAGNGCAVSNRTAADIASDRASNFI
jgi:hypothetical protein